MYDDVSDEDVYPDDEGEQSSFFGSDYFDEVSDNLAIPGSELLRENPLTDLTGLGNVGINQSSSATARGGSFSSGGASLKFGDAKNQKIIIMVLAGITAAAWFGILNKR